MKTSNFDITFIPVSNLCYHNLGSISLIVLKLCTFRQRSSFVITFDWNGNFEFWWFHLVQIYQNISYFRLKKYFFIYKNQFLRKKLFCFVLFFAVFFKLFPKFTDLLNYDDCIGKITHQNLSDYIHFIFKIN